MILSGTKTYIVSTSGLEDEKVFQSLYHIVSKERQDKIDRLRFLKDKRLSLAAEVLLGKALKLNGIDDFTLEVDENGKPYLKEISGLKFNLSHSEERVMCVISEKEVGCDVEWMKKPHYKMAEYFLTKEEITMLNRSNSEEEKQVMFYRFWTLKESFMKNAITPEFRSFVINNRSTASSCYVSNAENVYSSSYSNCKWIDYVETTPSGTFRLALK